MATYTVILPRWEVLERETRADVMDGTASAETYRAILKAGDFDRYVLDAPSAGAVFEILNIAHPADYRLRSLSVGDLIVGGREVALVAGIGFRDVSADLLGAIGAALLGVGPVHP